jgi:hypothetical protein
MAKRARGRRRGRISFSAPPKVRRILEQARGQVKTIRVLGEFRGGVLRLKEAEIAAVTRAATPRGVTFVALNAPFNTKALTGSV